MFSTRICSIVVTGVALFLSGCGTLTNPSIYRTAKFDDGTTIITDAKQRIVTNLPASRTHGQNTPTRIVCAEPSPDVAQSLSTSLTAALSLQVKGQGGSASFGHSSAEAIAQLGERLATVQLLRDGLYRACEAYANGAIKDITYAVLLSRYDDTMVSMMTAELAAGAFGRSLAAIGGEASNDSSTNGSGSSLLEMAKQSAAGAQALVDEKTTQVMNAKAAETQAQSNLDEARKDDPSGDHSAQEETVAATNENSETSKKELKSATEAATKTNAVATAIAAGAITRTQNPEVAKTLAKMQQKFIENINSDALVIACITALSQGQYSALAEMCKGEGGRPGIVEQIVEANAGLVATLKHRASLKHSVETVRDAKATLEGLENKRQEIRIQASN